ncbi:hypothetical protein TWF506_004768 [Arthrobotrys conoides]|uniref:BTB domain-containing protein n=1 Tax=Arthrobotrys conoides TaxID=74498 RepID=A0AAN8NFB8_9PEZI
MSGAIFGAVAPSNGFRGQLVDSEIEKVKKEAKQVSFESLINDTRFSDVQVIVGPKEVVYSLHRNFLTFRSDFFSCVLDPKWKESKDETVRLPEIHPPAFLAVSTWIYGGRFSIMNHTEYLAEIYKAADYLQIPGFKEYFFEQLISAVKEDPSPSTKRTSAQCPIPNPFTLLGKLLAVAPETDYPTLQQLATTLTVLFKVPWEEIHPFMTQEPEIVNAKVLFYMVAVGLDASDGKKSTPKVSGESGLLKGLAEATTNGGTLIAVGSEFQLGYANRSSRGGRR